MTTAQTQYQASFNEIDANNFLSFRATQPKAKQKPDSFSFGKKSFLTNSSSFLNSDSNLNSSSYLLSNSTHSRLSIPANKSPDEASRLSAYKQTYTYVGAEPHLTERVRVNGGAFGPNNEELNVAYKSTQPVIIEAPKSPPTIPRTARENRIKTSYGLKNSLNLDFSAAIQEKHQRGLSSGFRGQMKNGQDGDLFGKKLSHNNLFSTLDERPDVKSYDLRSVWIPKKYPGRNMFFSHLDSSMFPGKYDETEHVWKQLTETPRQNSSFNYDESNDAPVFNQYSSPVPNNSRIKQSRAGSVRKSVNFLPMKDYIINSHNKSIVPVIRTDNQAAANLAKSKNFTSNYLYHFQ